MRILAGALRIIVLVIWAVILYLTISLSFCNIFISLLFLLAADMLQTLIHEAGHLIGGLLSNYHFLSLHVGPFEIYKSSTSRKRVTISFTKDEIYGQCLMIPNSSNKSKFMLYNSAGIMLNIVAVCAAASFIMTADHSLGYILALSLMATGLINIIANIIPYLRKNSPNDMMIIMWLVSSKKTKADYFAYLRTYEKVAYGFPIEPNISEISFDQKSIDHYKPYFAHATSELTGFNAAVNLIEYPE